VSEDPAELIQRAARGDAEAVERLIEHHLPALRAFVRAHMGARVRARESTSDVVQSICRELLTHQERFRHPGEEAFKAWLFTTARRKLSNRVRDLERQKRDAAREVQADLGESALGDLGDAYARISSPSGAVLRREEIERLEAALDQLSPDHREVLTLAHLAGLSRAEIGRQMEKSEEAVRQLLHRATARLAILLEDGEAEPG
jgi:RNA polymerase sigma-70 factor (ECF subfamily)